MSALNRFSRLALAMVAMIATFTGAVAVAAPRIANLVSAHRSDHEQITLPDLAEQSYIFDSKGNPQGTLININNESRVQVSLRDVPKTVVNSVLASEDQYFWRHSGVNVRSILRAANANLEGGEVSQGGSTITQQVVKNSILTNEQSLSRKLREAFLAVELEKQIGKKKILERYLNSVYFGGGAYGVQAAASYYFNRDVKDLGWAEGALLAALIRSPAQYDPFKDPDLAKERRHIVIGRLVTTKRITQAQADLFDQVPLPLTPTIQVPPNDYFVEQVKQQLQSDLTFNLGATPAARNQTVFSGGIKVFTTFDPDLQNKAIQARDETLPKSRGNGTFEVRIPENERKPGGPETTYGTEAMASVQPDTGAVRALVGGPGYDVDPKHIDNATTLPGRQPGSSMKPITLAAAFENGYVPADTINGGSCTFKFPGRRDLYKPATGRSGVGSITTMTQVSSNCGFMRLSQLVGIDKVAEMGHRLGIRSPLGDPCGKEGEERICTPDSLTLGVSPVSVLDMAGAYATFANDGLHNKPYFVERIEDRNGKVIYQHQVQPERVVSEQVARQINAVLENNVARGTGTAARIAGGQPAAGKTGTTNDSTDVWFVGYTPQLATAIWMGAPAGAISLSNAGLAGATGGRYPGATWGRYYSLIFDGQEQRPFAPPEPTRRGKYLGKIPNEVGGRRTETPTKRRPTNTYKPPARTTPPKPPTGGGTGTGGAGAGTGGGTGTGGETGGGTGTGTGTGGGTGTVGGTGTGGGTDTGAGTG